MSHIKLAMLWSDWIVWSLFIIAVGAFLWMRKHPHLRDPWRRVLQRKLGMSALVILMFYLAVGLLDSVHFQVTTFSKNNQQSIKTLSLFDRLISPLGQIDEKTYSAPFATRLYTQSLVTLPDGKEIRTYAPLKYTGKEHDIFWRSLSGFISGLISVTVLILLLLFILCRRYEKNLPEMITLIGKGQTKIAWREALITFSVVWILAWVLLTLAMKYHILGTDKIGRDVFYETLKSIRTGLLIGTLTTIFMLPFALIFGSFAGYFRGWVDDIIQYLYTTLSSIPGVLLISAVILVLQVYISNHQNLFPTLAARADARLLALCAILGITSWASLCRLLRGETFKLRNQEFIQAAQSLGVRSFKIISRHIIPNVMHIVLITLALDFSGLVLAEAVLSYVGVGVDPTTLSWGNMINSSRLELAREPIVWWPLVAALIFMFLLVLSANIFADAVRDAFDPRLRRES